MYEETSNTTLLMLLNTAIYPFIAALIVSIVAGRLLRAWSYLGYLGGFLVGFNLIHSGLSFPPKQAIDYYSISILIGIASLICFTVIKNSPLRMIVGFILFGVSFYLLLNPVLKHSGWAMSLIWATGCALVTAIYCYLADKTKKQERQTSANERTLTALLTPIGLMIVAGAAAPVISIGGSLLIGQLLGVLAASLFGYNLASYITKQNIGHVEIPAFLILGGLISQSHVLADIPLSVMFMLTAGSFVTPLICCLINKQNNKQAITILVIQILISIAISGLSLWLVWPESSLY